LHQLKYSVSWSGGKDAALALYKAQKSGLQVASLFTMVSPQGYTMSHRLPPALLERQAQALGLPVVTGCADWNGYEAEFKRVLRCLKAEGYHGVVFGDIDIPEHRQWCRDICAAEGLTAEHPLWGYKQDDLLAELVALRFTALIVVVQLDKLGTEWLGRKLTHSTLEELKKAGVSPCGEFGEYHTLVVDGPIFQVPVPINTDKILTNGGYGFLDLT